MGIVENSAFIKPPARIPLFIKIGMLFSKKATKKDLLVPKLLAWYPKVAFSSGILEALVAHGKKDLNERILKLVRIQVSITVACPFCVDMNAFEYEKSHITDEEMLRMSGKIRPDQSDTLSAKERLAVDYAKMITETPIDIPANFIEKLKAEFTEREIVILSSTAAQVNYWARMLKSLGVPPAGFSDHCSV